MYAHVNKRIIKKKKERKRAGMGTLVAHTCNPSYSGGRDQEDCGSKSTPGK
jgi:hypothetical protein